MSVGGVAVALSMDRPARLLMGMINVFFRPKQARDGVVISGHERSNRQALQHWATHVRSCPGMRTFQLQKNAFATTLTKLGIVKGAEPNIGYMDSCQDQRRNHFCSHLSG